MRNELLGILPPFRNKKVLITEYQSTSDIITQLLDGHDKFKNDYDKISNKFWRGNLIASCKYVFDFLKKNVKYKIEPDTHQSIKSPSAIFSTGYTGKGYNDCKHYSSVFGGLIDSWIRKKKTNNVNWCYRFANYKLFQTQPHHVFVVIKNGGDEIWCDAVLSSFNEKKPYINKIDKKPKMALYQISGIGCDSCDFGIPRISGRKQRRAKRVERRTKRRSGENCTGRRGPKIAPPLIAGRKAFLLLVRLNVRKLGLKMYYVLQNPETRVKALEKWCALGGNARVLIRNVEKFKNKYNRKNPGALSGGYVGVALESAIATATPIIIALTPIIKLASRLLPEGKAKDILEATSEAGEEFTENVPTPDSDGETTGAMSSNWIWGGLALAGIYLITRKKK